MSVRAFAQGAVPVPPEVMTRDERGNVVIRAIKLTAPIRVDGRLDEPIYQSEKSFDGLVQNQPNFGKPATQRTDMWVFFDADAVYFSARCWDTNGPRSLVANEMRRDATQITQNDNIGIIIDTFHDRRNGYMFFVNPLGGMRDIQVTNEGNSNQDWNPVYDVHASRFEGGWMVEMRIPFKSIRYRPGANQVWGINVRRGIRKRNEWAHLTQLPATEGSGAWTRLSRAATLVGLEAPSTGKNVDIKPYAIAGVRSDRTVTPIVSNDVDKDAGFDVKYGLTKNLTADFSYNTDFAQVEVDEQQVNLTRFNLFFPEKREFFLEGRGIFEFARPNNTRGSVPVGGIVPDLFFSRQIGLNKGRVIPIIAGGRLTGRVGKTTIGMLNMQTDDEAVSRTPKTNFTVLRVRRDLFRRSTVGAMMTGRSQSLSAPGRSNQAYGIDGAFSFREAINFNGYVARTDTAGAAGRQDSYQARLDYNADRYGLEVDHLYIGDRFKPEVGFVQRPNIRRTLVSPRFSPRPKSLKSVRQFTWDGTLEYIEDTNGRLETRNEVASFVTEFQKSDRLTAVFTRTYDLLKAPFRLVGGPTIAAGGYTFQNIRGAFSSGGQRKVSGTLGASYGSYYDGTQATVSVSSGRVQVTPQFSLEPSLSVNWFDFSYGSLTTRVLRSRVNYTFTPRMFVSGLLQYNSSTASVSTNLRWRWEYNPGSELFVVYTDDRRTELPTPATPALMDRGLVVKINRLVRF